MSVRLQPVRSAFGNDDTEGQLVFVDCCLAAVLTHLAEHHGSGAGRWFLEAWFGHQGPSFQPTFGNLEDAQD